MNNKFEDYVRPSEEDNYEEKIHISKEDVMKAPKNTQKSWLYKQILGALISLVIINIGSKISINYTSEITENIVRLFGVGIAALGTKSFANIIGYIKGSFSKDKYQDYEKILEEDKYMNQGYEQNREEDARLR